MARVDPSQHAYGHEQMGIEIDPVCTVHHPALVERPLLDGRLDEHVQQTLHVNDAHGIAKGPVAGVVRAAVHRDPHDAVEKVRAQKQR
jgi:hypothetical protein